MDIPFLDLNSIDFILTIRIEFFIKSRYMLFSGELVQLQYRVSVFSGHRIPE